MRVIQSVLLLFLFSAAANAQSLSELWISMPGEMTPYLSLNQKREMVECYNAGVDTKVINQLKGNSLIDTLSVDYARITMSSSYSLQIVALPYENADSILCLIHSYKAPDVQSKLEFYDKQWRSISFEGRLPELGLHSFVARPDTMNVERFDELVGLLSPELVVAEYNPLKRVLEISVSAPLTTNEEKTVLNSIIRKKLLIWNGERFK